MHLIVECSNGHRLKAHEQLAGRKMACPKCQSPVLVPHGRGGGMSDSSVVALFADSARGDQAVITQPLTSSRTPAKVCPRCKTSMSSGYHICPRCRTYLLDTPNKVAITKNCAICGAGMAADEALCGACGETAR